MLHNNPGKTWVDVLPEVQEMVNSSPARALAWQTPTMVMFGQANRLGDCEEDADRCAVVAGQWWLLGAGGREQLACQQVPACRHLLAAPRCLPACLPST